MLYVYCDFLRFRFYSQALEFKCIFLEKLKMTLESHRFPPVMPGRDDGMPLDEIWSGIYIFKDSTVHSKLKYRFFPSKTKI